MSKTYQLTYKRRIVQTFFLILYFLFPLTGIFYFDSNNGFFVLLGKNLGLNNAVIIVSGFMILLLSVITMAITTGRSFCGWVCPQNFLSEIINKIINTLGVTKNRKIFAYILITIMSLFISLAVAINFMFYLGNTEDTIKLILSREVNGNIMLFAITFGLLVFAGVGIYRHDFCKYACPYGIMQASVADKTTLRVSFAKERSSECINCEACTDVCYVDIEPRKLVQADPGCMNCGLCVEACHNVLEPLGIKSMLNFTSEKDEDKKSLNSKAVLIIGSTLLVFIIYFIYSFMLIPDLDIMITRNDKHVSIIKNGELTSKYFLNIMNQTSKELSFTLSFEGLNKKYFIFDKKTLVLKAGEKEKIDFMIKAPQNELKKGIQKFDIIANNSEKTISKTQSSLFVPFN